MFRDPYVLKINDQYVTAFISILEPFKYARGVCLETWHWRRVKTFCTVFVSSGQYIYESTLAYVSCADLICIVLFEQVLDLRTPVGFNALY